MSGINPVTGLPYTSSTSVTPAVVTAPTVTAPDSIGTSSSVSLLASSTSTIPILASGDISEAAFFGTTNVALNASSQQNADQNRTSSQYYKGFGDALVNFIENANFLATNIDNYVKTQNDVNTQESTLLPPLDDDIGTLQNIVNQGIPAAVAQLNTASALYLSNGDLNAYNQAVSVYNGQIASMDIPGNVFTFNTDMQPYSAAAAKLNSDITFINSFTANFTPPQAPYGTLPGLTPLDAGTGTSASIGAPAAGAPGQMIVYTAPNASLLPTLPAVVPSVTGSQAATLLQPTTDAAQQAAAQLAAQGDDVNYFNVKQQFGFRTGVPQTSSAAQGSTSGGSSSASFTAGTTDPSTTSTTLASKGSADLVGETTNSLGVPTASPLVASRGFLASAAFKATGIYSARGALLASGFTPGPINYSEDSSPSVTDSTQNAPIASTGDQAATAPQSSSGASSSGSAAASAGGATVSFAAIGATPASVPPVVNSATLPELSPTSTQVTAGVATAAALGTIGTVSSTGSAVTTTVTNLVNTDPSTASLSPADKAVLSDTIGASVNLDLSLTSLFSLSVALGAPSLLQQYAGNVLPLQSRFPSLSNDSPLQTVISNPAYQVFIEASISTSLQTSLGISQAQADVLAQSILTSVAAQGNLQNAQQLSDAISSTIQSQLVASGVNASDAQASANQALSDLEDQQKFSAIQSAIVQEDQVTESVASSLIQQGVNQADADRIAANVADQNRQSFIQLAETSDAQTQANIKTEIVNDLLQQLGEKVSTEQASLAAAAAQNTVNTIGPVNLAIQSATPQPVISPSQLHSELSTLVAYNLTPLIGSENAKAQGDYFATQIVTSNNSLLNQNSDHVRVLNKASANTDTDKAAVAFDTYLAPTTKVYVAAQNFTDPGKLVTHTAVTGGLMYAQPVAAKNTPAITPV